MYKKLTEELPPRGGKLCVFRLAGNHPTTGEPFIPFIGYLNPQAITKSGFAINDAEDHQPQRWFDPETKQITLDPFDTDIEWFELP